MTQNKPSRADLFRKFAELRKEYIALILHVGERGVRPLDEDKGARFRESFFWKEARTVGIQCSNAVDEWMSEVQPNGETRGEERLSLMVRFHNHPNSLRPDQIRRYFALQALKDQSFDIYQTAIPHDRLKEALRIRGNAQAYDLVLV